MKTVQGILIAVIFTVPLWAQTAKRSGAVKVVNWTDQSAQSGGLEWLEKSAKGTSLTVGRVDAPAEPVQTQKPEETKPASVPAEQTASTPASETVSQPSQQPTPAAVQAASSATTLDIPLEMGNNSSVQTTVKSTTSKTPNSKTALEGLMALQEISAAESEEEAAADAELEYAARLLEKSKAEAASGRPIPPSAAKNHPATVPTANKKFNPNAFRPGVEWTFSRSSHFDIYTQKSSTGKIGSANLALTFEAAYQTLRRFIPWMMSKRVRVFIYEDHNAYLRYEPEAKAWAHALAYPTRGEIVVYDDPDNQKELKEVFTHELTHIFTQQFFDKHNTGRIMTPTWLDEGLAVLVEDQAYNGKDGGPWNQDFQTLNLQRDPSQLPPSFSSKSMFGFGSSSFGSRSSGRRGPKPGGKPVHLEPFESFMQEGSLDAAEGQDKKEKWYLQAYLMVRFLLDGSPGNRMRFTQFTRLLAEGEPVRNPATGFLVKDSKGKTVYQTYSMEKALSRSYNYNNIANFEDNFWNWINK